MPANPRFATSRFCWLVLQLMILLVAGLMAEAQDWRNIKNGSTLPSKNYADQPFVIVHNDGSWLVLLTTGPGKEGAAGQHIVSSISKDQGQSWTPLSAIEPSLPKQRSEASWVVPFHVPSLGEKKKGVFMPFIPTMAIISMSGEAMSLVGTLSNTQTMAVIPGVRPAIVFLSPKQK